MDVDWHLEQVTHIYTELIPTNGVNLAHQRPNYAKIFPLVMLLFEGQSWKHTCLLANTRSTASESSCSASIRIISSLASAARSMSLLSTTKITPENGKCYSSYVLHMHFTSIQLFKYSACSCWSLYDVLTQMYLSAILKWLALCLIL